MRKFILLLPLFLAACSDNKPTGDKVDSTGIVKSKNDSTSDWRSLTESWTASLNLKNASIMRSFYADSVTYYGDNISGSDVVMRQSAYFAQNADYRQKITEFIGEEMQPDGSWRIRITKQVTAGGKTADYPASLIYARRNGIWKIVAESDDISDINKARTVAFSYGASVTITGLVEETTGFGKTDGGDPKSDAKENYFIVWPSSLIDVNATASQPGMTSQKNVDRVQVEGDAEKIKALLNKKASITGTLAPASTPHHFTKVVLKMTSIEAAN